MGIDGDVAVGFLGLCGDGQAGGDGAVKGEFGEGAAARVRLREEPAGFTIEAAERSFGGEGIEVAFDPKWTGQPEVGLDFAE